MERAISPDCLTSVQMIRKPCIPRRMRGISVTLIVLSVVSVDAGLDMGANLLPGGRGTGFKVWAPYATSVKVELRKASTTGGSEVAVELVKGDGNIWYGVDEAAGAGDDYRYLVEAGWNDCFDQEGAILKRRDPYAR